MSDDLEYHLDDPGNNITLEKLKKKTNRTIIALVSIIIILLIIIIAGVILYFTLKSNNKGETKEKTIIEETQLFFNISTSENRAIRNSFIKGRENYIEELGDINNGKDYEETERNNFDLCIPYDASKDKTNYKTIVLNIHGGGWVGGNKADVIESCKTFGQKGFMLAAMSYTLLNGQYKEYNIFRIVDEITAVIKTLKKLLVQLGYDGNKLELFLMGGSAGAHLSMLYSYMIKNPPIPIKFVLNGVGPVSLIPDNWLTIKPGLEPLYNIEPEDITQALNNGSLIHMNGSITGVNMNNIYIMNFMNGWLGKPLNDSFDEIFSDINKREINKSSIIYQERINKAKYGFPITYITKESIPTLCMYSGKDEEIGVVQYALLKEAFKNNDNEKNISFFYFRYGTHNPFDDQTEQGINQEKKFSEELNNYAKKYLNSYKYNN